MPDPSHPGSEPEVWMINQYAITPDLPGGTRHYDFGCELAKRGYVVRIFASDVNLALRTHTKLRNGDLWREENVNGVRFVWVRAAEYRVNNWRRAWNMLSFTANVLRVGLRVSGCHPRTIIGSSPHPFAALGAWVLAKLKRAHFVLELRDLWPQALVDMGGLSERSLSVRGMRLLERWLYRVAEKIIILAPGSEGYLLSRGVQKDRIAYIPNGVHLGNFQAGGESSGEQIALDTKDPRMPWREAAAGITGTAGSAGRAGKDETFTVIYTGAHGPANSLETVLEAAHLLTGQPGIHFVLVGDGPSKAALIKKAQELALKNVLFMDPVPKEQIPSLLAAADAALITLRAAHAFAYAISPNKLFDYMAAGKPVLCAVPGDMAQLVVENHAGLAVDPENPRALAQAVIRLREMVPAERSAMGAQGRSLVESRFSRERLAEELIRVLG